MIDAKEAHRITIINGYAKKYIEILEKEIEKSAHNGEYNASINIDLEKTKDNLEIMDAIITEFRDLGYDTTFKFADPLPRGCRSDQWNFYNGYIKIEWDAKINRVN